MTEKLKYFKNIVTVCIDNLRVKRYNCILEGFILISTVLMRYLFDVKNHAYALKIQKG